MQKTYELTQEELTFVVRFIDLVASRGAIFGNEMALVGALRERFASYLNEEKLEGAPAEDDA